MFRDIKGEEKYCLWEVSVQKGGTREPDDIIGRYREGMLKVLGNNEMKLNDGAQRLEVQWTRTTKLKGVGKYSVLVYIVVEHGGSKETEVQIFERAW